MKALSKLGLHSQWATVLLSLVILLGITTFEFLPLDGVLTQVRQTFEASDTLRPLVFALIVILAVVIPPMPQRRFVLSTGLFSLLSLSWSDRESPQPCWGSTV